MEPEEKKQGYSIWIDWNRRIVSFEKVEDFEELQYPTYEEMLSFAIARGKEGFGIQ